MVFISKWNEEQRQTIERMAYFMWLDSGKPEGQDLKFWSVAENAYAFPMGRSDIGNTHILPKHERWSPMSLDEGVPLGRDSPPSSWGPVLLDPATFNPRKPILTRYGKKLLGKISQS
jgi:hypothetical protein